MREGVARVARGVQGMAWAMSLGRMADCWCFGVHPFALYWVTKPVTDVTKPVTSKKFQSKEEEGGGFDFDLRFAIEPKVTKREAGD